jgi:hypothetical protein
MPLFNWAAAFLWRLNRAELVDKDGRPDLRTCVCIQANDAMPEYEVRTRVLRTKHRADALVIIVALLAGIVLGLALVSAFSRVAHAGLWERAAKMLTGRQTKVDVSSPSVVEKIRQLSRLETVDYSIDKIVEGDRQNPYLPDFLVGDKLLLISHGEVIAGMDLSQLGTSDVSVHGDTVRVKLPEPQVLVTRIDNSKTRVYSRTTGLLVATDPNLESQVRMAAEQEITKAALADGILDKARQNGRNSITALLYGLGFHAVSVQ